jgi:hypothetical protein
VEESALPESVVEIGVVASIGLLFVMFYPGAMSIDSASSSLRRAAARQGRHRSWPGCGAVWIPSCADRF